MNKFSAWPHLLNFQFSFEILVVMDMRMWPNVDQQDSINTNPIRFYFPAASSCVFWGRLYAGEWLSQFNQKVSNSQKYSVPFVLLKNNLT